ncbi:MAG: sulfate reduction electron transfer complex DsrMKJOP subunit DsrP [Pseudomonadota bacterium]
MVENVLKGSKTYWAWVAFLLALIASGVGFGVYQWFEGLGITGMSRDVPWGFYIGQFTFLVGVAASAVMVVLPYYLHHYKAFGKLAVLGEFVAVSAVIMCMLFIFVDMGQPTRILNVFLHPTVNSLMFWDTVSLFGYFGLNVLITWVTFGAERKGLPPPGWIKPVIYLSIPWAVSIHTVTAFLYSGLGARPFWMTAVLAPRFLASAFAVGPSLLILFVLILRKVTTFDAGDEAVKLLSKIVTYAMVVNVFLLFMEFFTAGYSGIPEHLEHFEYLFFGLEGKGVLVPWMWTSLILAGVALVLLIVPSLRSDPTALVVACVAVIASLWIDKGLGLIIVGFIPSPLHSVTEYWPTIPEAMITLGIYGIGALLITGFYKIATSVRAEVRGV